MRVIAKLTSVTGELMIAFGALWAYLSHVPGAPNRGRYEILPDTVQNFPVAMSVATLGAVAFIGGKTAYRRLTNRALREAGESGALADPDAPVDWNDPQARKSFHEKLKLRRAYAEITKADPKTAKAAAVVASDPDRHTNAKDKPTGSRSPDMTRQDNRARTGAPGTDPSAPQERIALRPAFPQRVTSSWVGGQPMLPKGMDWPAHDGKPMRFLAQIGLEDLPDTLWQGLGPRRGWLAFFAASAGLDHEVAVRHVTGPVTERAQPEGVEQAWLDNMAPDALRAVLGRAADVPPRWFLEPVSEPVLGAVEDMEAENPDYYDSEKGAYIWDETWTMTRGEIMSKVSLRDDLRHGFDWPSFFGFFTLWKDAVEKETRFARTYVANHPVSDTAPDWKYNNLKQEQAVAKSLVAKLAEAEIKLAQALSEGRDAEEIARLGRHRDNTRNAKETARRRVEKMVEDLDTYPERIAKLTRKHQARLTVLEPVLQELDALERDLRAGAQETTWDPAIGAEVAALQIDVNRRIVTQEAMLAGMSEADAARHAKTQYGTAPIPLPARDHEHLIENIARHRYCGNPANVPADVMELFSPLWERQARETVVFLGLNHPGGDGPAPYARLIDLPTNPLTGQHFGDMSRLYMDMRPEDLDDGRFDRVSGENTHGRY